MQKGKPSCRLKTFGMKTYRTHCANFKAWVRYFLLSFYLSPNYSPSKTVTNVF